MKEVSKIKNTKLKEETFKRQQKRYLKSELKAIESALFKKLNAAFKSGAIPEHWKETGNYLLIKAVIHSFCMDGPYRMLDKKNTQEQNNLHLFI